MPSKPAALKRALSRTRRDTAGRRRYSKDLQGKVVAFARAEQAKGRPIIKIAAELGLREQVLGVWLRNEKKSKAIRAVEGVDESPPAPLPMSGLRICFPYGAAVEGLRLEDIAQLLREAP